MMRRFEPWDQDRRSVSGRVRCGGKPKRSHKAGCRCFNILALFKQLSEVTIGEPQPRRYGDPLHHLADASTTLISSSARRTRVLEPFQISQELELSHPESRKPRAG